MKLRDLTPISDYSMLVEITVHEPKDGYAVDYFRGTVRDIPPHFKEAYHNASIEYIGFGDFVETPRLKIQLYVEDDEQ